MPAKARAAEMDLDALRNAAESACRLMKALSNPARLLLLCHMAEGEKRVGELEELSGVVQPTLSQQLGVLRDEGLVSTRRDGKNIYYSIGSPEPLAVLQVLYEQFCNPPKGRKT
ncbi:MAG: metalloregulator ArsR/SmtB family transcription factor [Pseudomonadota bacterium]